MKLKIDQFAPEEHEMSHLQINTSFMKVHVLQESL